MVKRFVVVAGNIGSGKTGLTRLLSQQLEWDASYESVDDDPYLADFYDDMRAWSFHLQVFLLGHRARTHLAICASQNSVIRDRSIYEDAHIFARALRDMRMLSLRDYRAYRELYDLVIETLPPPDLLVYLQASVPTLMERIGRRGRSIESGITADYLERLDALYTEWIEGFNLCPVLTVPADDLDFIKHGTHLQIISDRILDRLQGKEEVVFPEM